MTKQAHIVAVSMGYGHLRAAFGLKELASGHVVCADDYAGLPAEDERRWKRLRTWYERVSRLKNLPLIGAPAFSFMDSFQRIAPFYPYRDLSAPTLQLRQIYSALAQGWCQHLVETLARDPLPFVSTFMTASFAAELHNYPGDIYTVLCDADVSRAWVALDPKRSRIRYIAPTGRVVERLVQYGVPEKNISLTGFPLPQENIGGPEASIVLHDLARRLCMLDPQGVFTSWAEPMLNATLGQTVCATIPGHQAHTPAIAFAIGGAGAQQDLCAQYLASLAPDIRAGRLRFFAIAGTHLDVAQRLRRVINSLKLDHELEQKKIDIIADQDITTYLAHFAQTMRDVDILITKPSELSFFAGLGIPIVMTSPVGSQEDFNRHWLYQVGAGVDALDPHYANEWLWDWINAGALARLAWNGYINAPTHGSYRINDVINGRPWSMHELPLVV